MTQMNGKFVLVSGSASRTCPDDMLELAIRFVGSFTEEVLRRGGGIVVLAGEEESARNEQGTALIFNWVALRTVERFAQSTMTKPRQNARIVMSDQAPESKIDDANLKLLGNLEQRNVVEQIHIRREVYTGGEYRTVMTDLADAMVAVGGGKGTYSSATAMTQLCKPVLPIDLRLGSITEDGEGAVALHREMLADTDRFFPNSHFEIKNRMGLLSLNRGLVDPESAALAAAEMASEEIRADQPDPVQHVRSRNPLRRVARVLKELSLVVATIRVVEFLRSLIPFTQL